MKSLRGGVKFDQRNTLLPVTYCEIFPVFCMDYYRLAVKDVYLFCPWPVHAHSINECLVYVIIDEAALVE